LPSRYQSGVRQAIMLFRFLENKENLSFAPVFTPLLGALEDASNSVLLGVLSPKVPTVRTAEKEFFSPILTGLDNKKLRYFQDEIKKLERTLIFRSPISPVGHLRFCLEYANKGKENFGGILKAVKDSFTTKADLEIGGTLNAVYQFRNKYIAHQEHATVSNDLAREQLMLWIRTLTALYARSPSGSKGSVTTP
jgi:type III restriction enzyme